MEDSPLGLLSFLTFGLSIIAAVLAIDMYTLLRTGQFGSSWRVMIIASVIFVLVQVLRLAEVLHWEAFQVYALTQIVELVFVMSLAYAFFLQRQAFTRVARKSKSSEEVEEQEFAADNDDRDAEWDDFTARYQEDEPLLGEAEAAEKRRTKSPSHSSRSVPKPPL